MVNIIEKVPNHSEVSITICSNSRRTTFSVRIIFVDIKKFISFNVRINSIKIQTIIGATKKSIIDNINNRPRPSPARKINYIIITRRCTKRISRKVKEIITIKILTVYNLFTRSRRKIAINDIYLRVA